MVNWEKKSHTGSEHENQ